MDAQFRRVRQRTWEGSGDNPVSQFPPGKKKRFRDWKSYDFVYLKLCYTFQEEEEERQNTLFKKTITIILTTKK